jgi:tetratricopeptide (TPR) repeat protein
MKNIILKFTGITFIFLVSFSSALALLDSTKITTSDEAEKEITALTEQIEKAPNSSGVAGFYVSRGDVYFLIHEFDNAEEDYSKAISINDSLDAAYFGRGMARGRQGYIKEGIEDLTVFIKRNPKSSLAYTKRGVRYIWLGDKDNALSDLSQAIVLDPENAEAHDDLGVVLAQKGQYAEAIEHFNMTVTLDPSYQKGYHNLAMALYITENDAAALMSVDNSLKLAPGYRGSMMLKAKILQALGRNDEATQIQEEAEFMPESGDWTEHAPIE